MKTDALTHPDHHRCAARARPPRAAGFTLIELMIVVAIVALLASLAYPAYTAAIIKGKRGEGRSAIADLIQQQERYLTQTGCYGVQTAGVCTTFLAGATNVPFKTFSGSTPTSSAYTLGVRQCTFLPTPPLTDCAEVFATPAFVDTKAGQLWMRSTGEKGCNGTDPTTCWK